MRENPKANPGRQPCRENKLERQPCRENKLGRQPCKKKKKKRLGRLDLMLGFCRLAGFRFSDTKRASKKESRFGFFKT
jgi:hypothetical protein